MRSAKEEAQTVLNNLPEDISIEQIQYHLYVLGKIRSGRDDVAQGHSYTQKHAKEKLGRWLKK